MKFYVDITRVDDGETYEFDSAEELFYEFRDLLEDLSLKETDEIKITRKGD